MNSKIKRSNHDSQGENSEMNRNQQKWIKIL